MRLARCLAYAFRAFSCDGTVTQFWVTQITSAIVGVVYERDTEHVLATFKMKWKTFNGHVRIP